MISLAAGCLLLLCAQPDLSLDEFLEKFAQARKDTMAIEASFEQKSILPDETLTTKGTLIYTRPRSILFRTQDPEVVTMVHQTRIYEFEPGIKQCLVYDARDEGVPEHMASDGSSLDVFFLAFENDTAKLKQHYDLGIFASDDPKGRRGLLIKPKSEYRENAPFEEASLYLRDTDYLPYRVRIVTDKDAQVLIEVGELIVHGQPAPDKVQVLLPEGTALVINDRLSETVGKDGKKIPLAPLVSEEASPGAAKETPAAPLLEIKELPAPSGAKQP